MRELISCEFNMDTVCVELNFADGSMISIDCIVVENKMAKNMYQQSELDYLIYNDSEKCDGLFAFGLTSFLGGF